MNKLDHFSKDILFRCEIPELTKDIVLLFKIALLRFI